MLITYHRFVSFSLYIAGLVWFVLSLVRKYYMKQFSLFAWTHVCLLIVVSQSYFIIRNIFEGLIWYVFLCKIVLFIYIYLFILYNYYIIFCNNNVVSCIIMIQSDI